MATDFTMDRIKKILERLQEHLCKARLPLPDWRYCECGYKTDNTIPDKNSDAFRKGEIKRGRVEVTASTGEGDSVVDRESSMKSIPEVTNIQQARNLLMSSPYDCQLSQLQNKSAVKAMAAEKNISFPNWL